MLSVRYRMSGRAGEGDPLRPRLDQHQSKKDFWTMAVSFVSQDEKLNKAHVQHLEARLIQLADTAKRCELDNANTPTLPSLSEMDAAEAEGFLDEILLCLPLMGVSVFRSLQHLLQSSYSSLMRKNWRQRGMSLPKASLCLLVRRWRRVRYPLASGS